MIFFFSFFFFFNDTPTTEIYTLSLHDALPISCRSISSTTSRTPTSSSATTAPCSTSRPTGTPRAARSEEHTSELQSHVNLVCRLLLEKKKKKNLINLRDLFICTNVLRCFVP